MGDGKLDAMIGGLPQRNGDCVILDLWRAVAGVHKLQLIDLKTFEM